MINNEVSSSHVLIEFDTIVDTDYGTLCTIYDKYHDTDIFVEQILEMNDKQWLGLLHDNPTTNPLYSIIDPDYEEYMDKYYTQLLDTELDYIYDHSRLTNMALFVTNAISTNGLCIIDILCKDKLEYSIMKRLLKDEDRSCFDIILYESTSDNPFFNVNKYSSIFIKYAESLYNYDNVIGKNIFIAELLHNIDKDTYRSGNGIYPDKLLTSLYIEANNIHTIRLYDYDNSYFINQNYLYSSDTPEFIDEYMNPGNDKSSEDDEDIEEIEEDTNQNIEEDSFDPGLGIDPTKLKEEDYIYE